jgi:short subunit dehydrogenase-like uncharacterized protein
MKIAVYGASGYQGALVASAIASAGLDPVMIGRDVAKLATTAQRLGLSDAEQRPSDLDAARLAEALAGCDAVVNCAGPFTVSGDAVARAAIQAGCHYVDTSGEQGHIKGIWDALAGPAADAGVSLIPASTDGGVPSDLVAALVADAAGPLARLRIGHRLFGEEGASRGSLRSALATRETLAAGGLAYREGAWQDRGPLEEGELQFPDDAEPAAVVRLAAPEILSVPRHVEVDLLESVTDAATIAALSAVTDELIAAVPPGPDDEARERGRFVIVADGYGRDGRRARGVVRGTDTYGTTSVIAVRMAEALALGDAPAGVLAPSQAVPPDGFLDGLADVGVHWSLEICSALTHA